MTTHGDLRDDVETLKESVTKLRIEMAVIKTKLAFYAAFFGAPAGLGTAVVYILVAADQQKAIAAAIKRLVTGFIAG